MSLSIPPDADWSAEPRNPSYPAPDPNGRWLVIIWEDHGTGRLHMRRYAERSDAFSVAQSFLDGETWVFEVDREWTHRDQMAIYGDKPLPEPPQ